MSWSLSVPQSSPEDFENAARKAHADHQNANGAWEPEAVEHFMAALKAAKIMAESMAPDGWEHQLVASMTGHANPNHAPQDGMSNDTMTVTVTQVPTNQIPPEPQPAPENIAWDTNQPQPAAEPAPEGVPPLPTPDNPVPVGQAVEAAPVWEQQVATPDVQAAQQQPPPPTPPTSEGGPG